MTSSYANVSLYTTNAEDAYEVIADEEAFISPAILGWVTVYERRSDEGDLARLAEIAARLGSALDCPALAMMVVGGDVFFYLLFEGGELVDEYASDPDFFGEAADDERDALSGDPKRLLRFAIPGTKPEHLRAILSDPDLGADFRRQALAARLGLENTGIGYRALVGKLEGARLDVVGWEDFGQAPPPDDSLDDEGASASPSDNGHYG